MIKSFYDFTPYREFPLLKQPFEGKVKCYPIFDGFFLHAAKRDGKYYFRYGKNEKAIEANTFGESLWSWFASKDCVLEEISLIIEHKLLDSYEIIRFVLDALFNDKVLRWDDYRFYYYLAVGYGKGLAQFRIPVFEPNNYWELDEYYSTQAEVGKYKGIYVSAETTDGYWRHYVYDFQWLLKFKITGFNRNQGISSGVDAEGRVVRLMAKKGSNWMLERFKNKPIAAIVGQEITVVYTSSSIHPYFSGGEETELLVLTNTREASEAELEHTRLKRGLRDFDAELRKGILIYEGN